MYELSKSFNFDCAHTLDRVIGTETSRRIHGHSYRGEVTVRGMPDDKGMLVDIGFLELALEKARDALNDRFLNDIPELGTGTMENLCAYIHKIVSAEVPNIVKVAVHRDQAGETCIYFPPEYNATNLKMVA